MRSLRALLATSSVLAAALVVPSLPAWSTPASTWHSGSLDWTGPGPNAPTYVDSLSCVGSNFCVGVGGQELRDPASASPIQPIVESWNGVSWTESVLGFTGGATGAILRSVSCVDVGDCVAVGVSGNMDVGRPFAATLAGGLWTVQLLPTPRGQPFASFGSKSISCVASSECVVVGTAQSALAPNRASLIASSRFSDTLSAGSWSNELFPVSTARWLTLLQVSCWAATSCAAVGDALAGPAKSPTFHGVIATLAGSTWTVHIPALPRGSLGDEFSGISCVAGAWCAVVGQNDSNSGFGAGALVGTLANQVLTFDTSTTPADDALTFLQSVSCVAVGTCLAYGFAFDFNFFSSSNPAVVATLAAGSWTVTNVPAITTAQIDPNLGFLGDFVSIAFLEENTSGGLSCTSATSCTLIRPASDINGLSPARPVASAGYGTSWSSLNLPVNARPAEAVLNGIDCVAVGHCVAVGAAIDSLNLNEPIVSTLRASGWSSAALPVLRSQTTVLNAVSCASGSSCLAVGGYVAETGVSAPTGLLVESWNGAAWTPKHFSLRGYLGSLSSVSCPAATWCVAVGSGQSDLYLVTKSGASWTKSTFTPRGALPAGRGPSVSCASVGHCVLVGDVTIKGVVVPFSSTLSARAWHFRPLNVGALTRQYINSVSCATATHCVAVGQLANQTSAVIDTWNGTTWTARPLAIGDGFTRPTLQAVSCWTTSSCVAVGSIQRGLTISSFSAQLAKGEWTVSPVASAEVPEASGITAFDDEIHGVSCRPEGACVGVGSASTSLERQPYVTRWW